MLNKKVFMKLISLIVILSLFTGVLFGCSSNNEAVNLYGEQLEIDINGVSSLLGEKDFDIFINELFVDAVTSNSITLNYTLADITAFDNTNITPTLGEVVTIETAIRDREKSIKEAARLHDFDYMLLREDQKIVYDILTRSYELNYTEEFSEDQVFYLGYIRPLNGIQIQLPIILAELNFRTIDDFDMYFALLEDTPRYFSEIIEFERERSRRGFFLSTPNVDAVLKHINSYLRYRKDNFLILVINDIIDEFDGFTTQEKIEYKQKNQDLVLNRFLPAYESLLSAIRELRGVGERDGGLSNLPEGTEYAQMYLQHRTDSDMTLSEMRNALEDGLDKYQEKLFAIWSEYPELLDKYLAGVLGVIPYDTPENYMLKLEQAIKRDFPPLREVNLTIREVHESLQEHMSPAFYLSPPFDDFINNVVYTNPLKINDNFSLFTILAHEGYPGHMYQFVYFRQLSPHPIRGFLTGIGYSEGWASYAEYESFFMAGLDEVEAEILKLIRIIDLIFISIIDLNVNAFGWDIHKLISFLSDMGINNPIVAEDLFDRVTGVPLFYLPYTIGYIELVSLREEAETRLGDDFVPKDFNRFILEFGPAPFSILRQHFILWINSQI